MAEVTWQDDDGDGGRVTLGREPVVALMAEDRGEAPETVEADLDDRFVALVECLTPDGEPAGATFLPREAVAELVPALVSAALGEDDLTQLGNELSAIAEDARLPSGESLTVEGAAAWAEGWLLTLRDSGLAPAAGEAKP